MPSPRQRQRVFVVSESRCTVASVVERLAPGDLSAISEGRIFIDDKRAERDDVTVERGTKITWYLQRNATISTCDTTFSIVARRGDLVVASKPSTWTCEPDRTGSSSSLREAVAAQLGVRNVHVLTRLDVGVSGLVLLALTRAASSIAASLQKEHLISKLYFALVKGTPISATSWNGPACSGLNAVTQLRPVGQASQVRWADGTEEAVSILSIKPITGRKHQIRIHCAHYGHPLLGDRRYGGLTHAVKSDGTVLQFKRPLLHAYQLVIPWESQDWVTNLEPPADMIGVWRDLGGDDSHLKM